MHLVFLSLGSNLGRRKTNMRKAVGLLESLPGSILELSSMYETEPWGCDNPVNFYNQAVKLSTTLSPVALLDQLHQIEKECGRVSSVQRFVPRKMDLDILLYDQLIIMAENLMIPHPLMSERKFVLVPLDEIAPEVIHPVLNKTIHQLLSACRDSKQVFRIG